MLRKLHETKGKKKEDAIDEFYHTDAMDIAEKLLSDCDYHSLIKMLTNRWTHHQVVQERERRQEGKGESDSNISDEERECICDVLNRFTSIDDIELQCKLKVEIEDILKDVIVNDYIRCCKRHASVYNTSNSMTEGEKEGEGENEKKTKESEKEQSDVFNTMITKMVRRYYEPHVNSPLASIGHYITLIWNAFFGIPKSGDSNSKDASWLYYILSPVVTMLSHVTGQSKQTVFTFIIGFILFFFLRFFFGLLLKVLGNILGLPPLPVRSNSVGIRSKGEGIGRGENEIMMSDGMRSVLKTVFETVNGVKEDNGDDEF